MASKSPRPGRYFDGIAVGTQAAFASLNSVGIPPLDQRDKARLNLAAIATETYSDPDEQEAFLGELLDLLGLRKCPCSRPHKPPVLTHD